MSVNNKLLNIYNLINNVGFYYNLKRKKESVIIRKLSVEKIKNRNLLYKILNYIISKSSITTKNLEEELNVSKGFVNCWMLYLYKNDFVIRKRREDRWFEYYPKINNINKILKNPLRLEELPRLKI